jgi:D-tyrosyl-tRNA(Tyr) deacylase
MKAILQRVQNASVTIDGKRAGEIDKGYVILLGVAPTDTQAVADRMVDKIKRLRIFPDAQGKSNLSIEDIQGEVLVISQFTLYADCRKGNRPSFVQAAPPQHAEALYDYFVQLCRSVFAKTACGMFGASMKVALVNDGPFTVVLDMD